MTKLIHSLPWTLALTLAAQAGESEAIRIPTNGTTQECSLDIRSMEVTEPDAPAQGSFDRMLYDRIKKSLEM